MLWGLYSNCSLLTLWGWKATIVTDSCKKFFLKNELWSHPLRPNHPLRSLYFSCVNGLFCGFWQITRYTSACNIIHYLNTFYYPKCFLLQIYQKDIKKSDSSIMYWWIYGKKKQSEMKNFIVEESLFSAKQSGKIRFCIGYFVYEIHGIKGMCVQKPWLFINTYHKNY